MILLVIVIVVDGALITTQRPGVIVPPARLSVGVVVPLVVNTPRFDWSARSFVPIRGADVVENSAAISGSVREAVYCPTIVETLHHGVVPVEFVNVRLDLDTEAVVEHDTELA